MSDGAALPPRTWLSALVAATRGWLIEPADELIRRPPASRTERVVGVTGLAAGVGATTVARALGAELAARGAEGTAIVAGGPTGSVRGPAAPRARRLVRDLAGYDARACGRLALVPRHHAAALAGRLALPVVLDLGAEAPAPADLALAERVVVVTGSSVEPALADVAATLLTNGCGPPLLALNRVDDDSERPGHLALPASRLDAAAALAGRRPRGRFGAAVAVLTDELGP